MKRALVVWNRGLQFVGNSGSGHAIVVDAPRDDGGSASGPSNTELLLIAFGGCTGMDVALILGKMRVEFDDFEIALEGEVPAEYPKTMTRIHLTYRIWGDDIPEDSLKRAIELSREKYCTLWNTLNGKADVAYEYRINPDR